jgi:hypothetical protein
MADHVGAATGRISVPGIAGVIGRVAGAYLRRPGWSRYLRICPAVFTAAALAGCGPGHAAGKSAAAAASKAARHGHTVTGPVPATADTTAGAGTTKVCVKLAAKSGCGPYLYKAITQSSGHDTYVGQDVWNPIPGWSQALHATSPGTWYVIARMPAGNTAVVSFPNVEQQYYYTNTLTGFSSIYSSFTESMHPEQGTSAEAAYDIWLNDWRNEVMIQHDIVNRGACPVAATAVFGGSGGVPVQRWNLCKYGSELIWQLSGAREQSGSVNILSMLTWLATHGYLPERSGLTAISYGFEICSTGGQPETFTVSRFSISAPEGRQGR